MYVMILCVTRLYQIHNTAFVDCPGSQGGVGQGERRHEKSKQREGSRVPAGFLIRWVGVLGGGVKARSES